MSDTSYRYQKAIMAKLKMLQARHEFERAKREFESNLTVTESKCNVSAIDAQSAFINISEMFNGVEIVDNAHVEKIIKYKDIEIDLHDGNLSFTAMSNIIKA